MELVAVAVAVVFIGLVLLLLFFAAVRIVNQYERAYTGAQPPAKVQVSNIGDVPVANKVISVVDEVTGQATYNTDTQALTINAVSSDTAAAPTLTAAGYGALAAGTLAVPGVDAPPPSVTVSSAAGGSVSLAVQVTGAGRAPIAVVAQAGGDQSVVSGATVTLDGSSSRGDIATFAWTSPAGVSLNNPTTATPSFVVALPHLHLHPDGDRARRPVQRRRDGDSQSGDHCDRSRHRSSWPGAAEHQGDAGRVGLHGCRDVRVDPGCCAR